jgi:hypothetical protein
VGERISHDAFFELRARKATRRECRSRAGIAGFGGQFDALDRLPDCNFVNPLVWPTMLEQRGRAWLQSDLRRRADAELATPRRPGMAIQIDIPDFTVQSERRIVLPGSCPGGQNPFPETSSLRFSSPVWIPRPGSFGDWFRRRFPRKRIRNWSRDYSINRRAKEQ